MINKVEISCFYQFRSKLVQSLCIELNLNSVLTKFWLFSSKSAENNENGHFGFLTIIIKESNVFI